MKKAIIIFVTLVFIPLFALASCVANTHSASFTGGSGVDLNLTSTLGVDCTKSYSYSFWFKITTNPGLSKNYYVTEQYITSHCTPEQFLYEEDGSGVITDIFRKCNNTTCASVSYNTDYSGTGWHFAVMTSDTTHFTLYIDGTLQGQTADIADGDAGYSTNFIIGCNSTGGTQCYKGLIDDFRAYSVALNSTNVSNLYSSPASVNGSETNLLAGYNFDSSLTADVLGVNNLTISGTPSQSTDIPFTNSCPSTATYIKIPDSFWMWFQ